MIFIMGAEGCLEVSVAESDQPGSPTARTDGTDSQECREKGSLLHPTESHKQ